MELSAADENMPKATVEDVAANSHFVRIANIPGSMAFVTECSETGRPCEGPGLDQAPDCSTEDAGQGGICRSDDLVDIVFRGDQGG